MSLGVPACKSHVHSVSQPCFSVVHSSSLFFSFTARLRFSAHWMPVSHLRQQAALALISGGLTLPSSLGLTVASCTQLSPSSGRLRATPPFAAFLAPELGQSHVLCVVSTMCLSLLAPSASSALYTDTPEVASAH